MRDAKQQRPAFQALEADDMDVRLEAQAAEKGIPTLVTPAPDGTQNRSTTATAAGVPSKAGGPVDAQKGTPRARMKTVNFEVPDYAWIELKMLVAREMVSVRYLLLSALRSKGISIRDVDMIEEGRRLRGGERNR